MPTSKTLSPAATRLWKLANEVGGTYTLIEIQRELSLSKTAIQRAMLELEEAGLVSLVEE